VAVARRRLGTLSLVTGTILGVVLVALFAIFPIGRVGFPIGVVTCFLHLGIWFLCRRSKVPDDKAFPLAVVLAILVAWASSLGVHLAYEARIQGLTITLLGVYCLPFYAVAMSRARTVLVASLMAMSQPIVAFLSWSAGWAQGTPRDLFISVAGALVSLVIAVAATDLIRVTRRETASDVGGYTLTRKIGEGGMGEVWEGRHRLLARPAAVKLLANDGLTSSGRERFEREAQATALLTSEHTVRLFDFGTTEDGRVYYVMELLHGMDFEKLVAERGPLEPAHVAHLMDQVCDSVGEAHEAGIVHRDIKPSNLFLSRSGLTREFVKVLDFGLVSVTGGLTLTHAHPGDYIGTATCSPPEALFGRDQDARSDVYQLGCVMFFLLAGRNVFPGDTVAACAIAHVNDAPPRPSSFAPSEIPEDLERLIMRCLAKDPDARPSSGKALRAQLRELECFGDWTEEEATGFVEAVTHAGDFQIPVADALREVGARAGAGA
jgi:serine/threonine-protein kinase